MTEPSAELINDCKQGWRSTWENTTVTDCRQSNTSDTWGWIRVGKRGLVTEIGASPQLEDWLSVSDSSWIKFSAQWDCPVHPKIWAWSVNVNSQLHDDAQPQWGRGGLYPPVIICRRPKGSVKFILLSVFSLLASHWRLWTAIVSLWPSLLFLYSIFLPITAWQIELARKRSIIVPRLILICPLLPPLLSLRLSFSCCPHYGTFFSFLHRISPHH